MKTYRWLTLGAALIITAFEAWLFNGANAAVATPMDAPTAVVAGTATSRDTP